ncbi:LacI family DNA-binding transcriptional regulator [Sphingomonas aerophila]|jgi:LacI family transcriptional regulator|uniref:LacI family transcriptional regulator n=1 Tax=Sphingomonas aerophila TaxID=1344948 RepID=A0A7W9BER9_9SPHN|nr:LacI family DNA-binding transcriptional regulator [Sphingomonas aerophila]MBB5715693.1 LacI family transcriptional regulator [Sphingomonas aerophila]
MKGQVLAEPGRATIIDVGRAAGVSAKTVSRVFNGERYVSEGVAQRVREAAAALNYHPNMLARALVSRRSHLIGLVYERPSPSYVVDLQEGVLARLKDERYRLVVIPVASMSERAAEVVGLLRSAALDGVVLAPPASDDPRILADLAAAGIRSARIAPTRDIEAAPSNLIDDISAAREIAAYVLGLGHRDVAVILGDPTHAATDMRLAGYRQAFAAAGVEMAEDLIGQGAFSHETGYAAAAALLAGPRRFTAILAQNDDMAVGALLAAREAGLRVPEDLSIIGFDDSEVSRISWPRITTIRQPVFDMAVAAADMVIAQLEGREPRRRVQHAHQLIIRESVAPPPAG